MAASTIKIDLGTYKVGKSGNLVCKNAKDLAEKTTLTQLNRIADNYMDQRFSKVSKLKAAETLFPVLLAAMKSSKTDKGSEKPEKQEKTTKVKKNSDGKSTDETKKLGRGNKKYTICNPKDFDTIGAENLQPQCKKIIGCILCSLKDGEQKEVTKEELLEILESGGFTSRGNPWNNVMFNRRVLIDFGVMA